MRKMLTLAALMLVLGAPAALAQKGASMFSIGISQGTADLYDPFDAGNYISAFSTPEIGVSGEYWHMFSDDYGFALQGTFGFSSEKDEPGDLATPGSVEGKFSTTSYKVRVGGDRVGKIGDRFTWFMGPGLEFWSGKAKFEGFAPTEIETENITRFGINGRFGGVMALTPTIGIMGQIGHTLGLASAEDQGSKATWYPSSFNAAWGLHFTFGGQ
jgi:hypothetical protein